MMKRGSLADASTILIAVLIISVTVVLAVYVNNSIYTNESFSAMLNSTGEVVNASTPMVTAQAAVVGINDLIVFLMFAAAIGAIISASQIKAHPKFFFFTLVLQMFLIVLSTVLTTIYTDFASRSGLDVISNMFPNFKIIFDNAPILTFFITILVALSSFIFGGGASE